MKKQLKIIFTQDIDLYENHIVVCVGDKFEKLKKYIKKEFIKEYFIQDFSNEKKMIEEDKIDGFLDYDFKYNIALLYLKNWTGSWYDTEVLIHELHHFVYHFSHHHEMINESEGQAYLQQYLFKEIRKKLNKKLDKLNSRKTKK